MKRADLHNKTFNRWTVLGEPESRHGAVYWSCLCQCGTQRMVAAKSLVKGLSPSCGCINKERMQNQGTHNQSGRKNGNQESREYRIWTGMWKRCTNPKSQRFEKYGGRGISVCARWASFQFFFEDMGRCPEGHSIERADNDGDYSPENCRWATNQEQSNNRTTTIHVVFNNRPETLATAVRKAGVSYAKAYKHILRGESFGGISPDSKAPNLRLYCGFSPDIPKL